MINVVNILKNAQDLGLDEVNKILTREVLSASAIKDIYEFEAMYKKTLTDYYGHPQLKFSSMSFELDKLDIFQKDMLQKLSTRKIIFVPMIVMKMMKGDALAHSMYKEIYSLCELAMTRQEEHGLVMTRDVL